MAVVCAAAALAAACNPSPVDPGAEVRIEGAVYRQDGAPVAGVPVALMREPDAFDVFVGVVSVGLSCLEAELSECGERRLATSGGDGTFSYSLRGRDTQGRLGTASVMELSASLPRSGGQLAGPAVSTRFQVHTTRLQVPLRVWEPDLQVIGAGGAVRVTWSEPGAALFPPQADLGALRRWVVFEAGPGEEVWRAEAGPGSVELDARILEDSRGGVSVFAGLGGIKAPAEAGTDVEVLLRSARLPYASPAGRPASRGRPCFVPDASGRPVAQTPCRATDGRFDAGLHPVTCPPGRQGCAEPPPRRVWVDLGREVEVALVVVRGCSGLCALEASADGAGWSEIGAGGGAGPGLRDLALAPGGAVRARYVGVSGDVSELRELSVWDPTPVSVNGPLRTAPQEVNPGLLPRLPAAQRGGRLWLVLVAAGAVAAAAALRRRATRATNAQGARQRGPLGSSGGRI